MTQIKIEGVAYEMPETFTLKELRILERYTEGHLGEDGYSVGKLSGMIHVAILRARPELPFNEIQDVVDQLDPDSLDAIMGGQSPPAVTENENEQPEPSNDDSSRSSDPAQENGNHESSGPQGLPTGFTSFHGTSKT